MKHLPLSMSVLVFGGVMVSHNLASADVGRIVSGTAGWNGDNVVTHYFDVDGNASATLNADGSYQSYIYDRSATDSAAVHMGSVIAKNPPVGEPPGLKVVNAVDTNANTNAEARDTSGNCIISTAFLDEDPSDTNADYSNKIPVTCSSPFQTHKRFKILMLPEMVNGDHESVDLVFNVKNDTTVDDEVIQYTVYQKINNWTNSRLQGYTLELGFGVGTGFTAAMDTSLTFNNTENSAFSHGLFGPIEENKFPENGFFSSALTGYQATGENLTKFQADTAFGAYPDVQGAWLPAAWVPYGIFFDDDGDPDTDAVLMAWWGKGEDGTYQWMYGQLEHYAEGEVPAGMTADFAPVPAEQITTWLPETVAEGTVNPYSIDLIDDFANLNLNYVINVGAIGTWPTNDENGAKFTVRITPTKHDGAAPEHTLEANHPPQLDTTPDDNTGTDGTTDTSSSSGGAFGFDPFTLFLIVPLLGGLFRRRKV